MEINEKKDDYIVLINEEEQFSIWQAHHPIPEGWQAVGPQGTEEDCMTYVDSQWTDMRPKSLREKLG